MRLTLILAFLLCNYHLAISNVITGDIADYKTKQPLSNVAIENIHSNITVITDISGKFTIACETDHLLEFRKEGYKTVRLRIPKGTLPPYFKIFMEVKTTPPSLDDYLTPFQKDSLENHELYEHYLSFEKLKGVDVIRHPFSAMSKKNRMIWKFQDDFEYFQNEKFIDFTFNEKLVQDITGLKGDSLQYFMRRFRPTYEQLRSMNTYHYYRYIKLNAAFYRTGIRPDYRPRIRRSSD